MLLPRLISKLRLLCITECRRWVKEVFLQVAIYCGVPAGVDSFRIAREVFTEMGA